MKSAALVLLCVVIHAAAEQPKSRTLDQGVPTLTFDHDVSPILGAKDDYISTYSPFDYAAKFNSKVPLKAEQRAAAFKAALQDYSPEEIARLRTAFEKTFKAMKAMTVKLPDKIHIFSEETIESGAAYTRANTICMPKGFIARLDDGQLAGLAAHEIFHVVSRYNMELRPEMYAILGFEKVEPPTLPEPLASQTIANPDAPGMDYVIKGEFKGKKMHFLPILHSKLKYTGGNFFRYLNDDLLAVTIEDGKASPILEKGAPLIVKKEAVKGYYDQVGTNTHYTFHPEETTADHFKLLLFGDLENLPNPDKVKALDKILRK